MRSISLVTMVFLPGTFLAVSFGWTGLWSALLIDADCLFYDILQLEFRERRDSVVLHMDLLLDCSPIHRRHACAVVVFPRLPGVQGTQRSSELIPWFLGEDSAYSAGYAWSSGWQQGVESCRATRGMIRGATGGTSRNRHRHIPTRLDSLNTKHWTSWDLSYSLLCNLHCHPILATPAPLYLKQKTIYILHPDLV